MPDDEVIRDRLVAYHGSAVIISVTMTVGAPNRRTGEMSVRVTLSSQAGACPKSASELAARPGPVNGRGPSALADGPSRGFSRDSCAATTVLWSPRHLA